MSVGVDKDVCEARHGELSRRLDVADLRLNAHSESITDVKEAIIRLTTLQETLMNRTEEESRTPKFWETSAGQFAIKVAVVTGAVIILAAIGKNIDESIWLKLFGG